MRDEATLLFANEAFYEAFAGRDTAAMEALWAKRHPVAVIHPGWHALAGREAVMRSWRGILENPEAPDIACRGARAFVQGEAAFVVCYEVLGDSVLAATNVFVREDGEWRLVHHQAGPCPAPAPGEPDEDAAPRVQ
jgi:ketosteroid isomerase-like protein